MSGWIKCSDRLPERYKKVLIITEFGEIYVAEPNNDFSSWEYSSCCGCHTECATHWMPLPEPPKESDGE